MNLPPIIQKTYIASSAEKIFDTITSSEGWDSWFTTGSEVKINDEGKGNIKFVWKDWGPYKVSAEDSGEILSVKRNKNITFNWSPTNRYPTEVSITLDENDKGTVVTVTETGYLIDDAVVCLDCATGWGEALNLLKMYIEYGITTKES